MSVLERLPLIGVGVTLSDRALRNTVDAIHLIGAQLANSVPMDCGSILVIVVLDMNDKFVTPAGFNQRGREGFIENLAGRLLEAIRPQLNAIIGQHFRNSSYCTGTYSEVQKGLQ